MDSLSGITQTPSGPTSGLRAPVPLSGLTLGTLGMGGLGGGSMQGTVGGGGMRGGLSLFDLMSLLQGDTTPATDLDLQAGVGAGGIGSLGQYGGIGPSSLGFGAGGFQPGQGFLGAGDPRSDPKTAAAAAGGAGSGFGQILTALGLAGRLGQIGSSLIGRGPDTSPISYGPTGFVTTPEMVQPGGQATYGAQAAAEGGAQGLRTVGLPAGVGTASPTIVGPEATQTAYQGSATPVQEPTPQTAYGSGPGVGQQVAGGALGALGVAQGVQGALGAQTTQGQVAGAGQAAAGGLQAANATGLLGGAGGAAASYAPLLGSFLSGYGSAGTKGADNAAVLASISPYLSVLGGVGGSVTPFLSFAAGLGNLIGTLTGGDQGYAKTRIGEASGLQNFRQEILPAIQGTTTPTELQAALDLATALQGRSGFTYSGNVADPMSLTGGFAGTHLPVDRLSLTKPLQLQSLLVNLPQSVRSDPRLAPLYAQEAQIRQGAGSFLDRYMQIRNNQAALPPGFFSDFDYQLTNTALGQALLAERFQPGQSFQQFIQGLSQDPENLSYQAGYAGA